MRLTSSLVVVLAIALARPTFALQLDEATKQFDSLFGESIRQATNSTDPADDIALAKKLVEAAASVTDKPELLAVMLEKAYELCAKDPTGTATAIQAMEVMADRLPEKKDAANQRIIVLLTRDFSRAKNAAEQATTGQALVDRLSESGEAKYNANDYTGSLADYRKALPLAIRIKSASDPVIRSRIEFIGHRQRDECQESSLQARILENRKDVGAANELVHLLVIELDRVPAAMPYTEILTDEDTKKHVTLASKSAEDLSAPETLALGTWYEGQAKKASAVAKRRTLERAASYIQSFINQSSEGDQLVKLQADLALKRVQTSIKELTPEPTAPKDTERVFAFNGKPISIEAEKAQVISEPMKIDRIGSAAGGAFIWRPGAIGQRNEEPGGYVVFHVKVEQAGDLYIWGRVRAPDESNNSFNIAVTPGKETSGQQRRWDLPSDARNWTWVAITNPRDRRGGPGRFGPGGFGDRNTQDPEPQALRFEAGINSIIVSTREHGAQLDTIYISKSAERPR